MVLISISRQASIILFIPAFSGGIQASEKTLEAVVVEASSLHPISLADSANQGTVTAQQLENRPLLRTGELLEVVPGMIVTQHSGDGKANQYFARGFNLDHGTDFRTIVMGMPVNLPTNAHGDGYSDLNFVIPELVNSIQYKKGTYYAEEGDFSAAGAAAFDYFRTLDQGLFSVTFYQQTGSSIDSNGAPVMRATPLVKTIDKEAGLHLTGLIPGLQTSPSFWQLDLDSELVFVGDAGTTEAGRPSHRRGIEIANYYVPAKGWIIDADLAWSRDIDYYYASQLRSETTPVNDIYTHPAEPRALRVGLVMKF